MGVFTGLLACAYVIIASGALAPATGGASLFAAKAILVGKGAFIAAAFAAPTP